MIGAPNHLAVENQSSPFGIEPAGCGADIRLSWWSGDDRPAEVQSAYEIQAASSMALLLDEPDLWHTGRVNSTQRVGVPFGGELPEAGSAVYWRVRTYDSDGEAGEWSDPASFTVWDASCLDDAHWIGAPLRGNRLHSSAVPVFRRQLEIEGVVQSSRLVIAALGAVQVRVNGVIVEPLRFGTGWTDYAANINAREVMLDEYLQAGTNTVEVLLSDGWYAGSVDGISRQHYGDQAAFAARLEWAAGEDATHHELVTDNQWQWQASQLLSSDVTSGESLDGRAQLLLDWSDALVLEKPGAPVRSQRVTPLASMERVAVGPLLRQVPERAAGMRRWVADLGMTLFGQLRMTIDAQPGDFVKVSYACEQNERGEPIYTATDDYTAHGDGEESFEPLFSMHGVRWLMVEGDLPIDGIVELSLQQVGTNLLPVSNFRSDHGLVNRYYEYCRRTLDNILLDVPVSGVSRNQRIGRVAEMVPLTGLLPDTFDVAAYLRQWLQGVATFDGDSQEEGSLPLIYPPVREPVAEPSPISIAPKPEEHAILPILAVVRATWSAYRRYADRSLLMEVFPVVRRALRAMEEQAPGLICRVEEAAVDTHTPTDLVGTALFHEVARHATRMAGVLGRLGEMENLDGLAHRIRSSFRRRFVTPDGALVGDTATACVLGLSLDLLEGNERLICMARLEQHIQNAQYHMCVDRFASDRLLDVLAEEDRLDLAYALFLQTSGPSWLNPLMSGERAGADASWTTALRFMYRHLAGLRDDPDLSEEGIGFRHVLIRPRPPIGPQFPEGPPLSEVTAHYDSAHGRYVMSWQVTDRQFELEVEVPCGCRAQVVMPDGVRHRVDAGRHEFVMPFLDDDDGIPVLQDSLNN